MLLLRDGQAQAPAIHRADYQAPAWWIDTVDLTFDLVNEYDQIPAVSGTPLLTKGAGSTTTKIVAWYIKTQTKSQIVVTVEIDQAAGTGKDNTVTMCAYIAGPQA